MYNNSKMTSIKEECNVCTNQYTQAVNKKKVQCNYCEYNSCVGCAQKYLLSQAVDAHCMSCRMGWNREFIDLNMTKTFRTKEWREHKKIMILNREKALLPTMQVYAAAKKMMDELKHKHLEQSAAITIMQTERSKNHTKLHQIKNRIINNLLSEEDEVKEFRKLDELLKDSTVKDNEYIKADIILNKIANQYQNQIAIYYNTSISKKEKREFILKCIKEDCRGFLSTSYKCELCSTFVCKDCMIIKKEKDDADHTCKKEDIDTVSMIRKDTRPCPKCGIRISKIDGCDQMWCVAEGCGTAFSWNTGKIVSGVIHNPHYYEWVRRNNNGVVPRNVGDNPCNERIQYYSLCSFLGKYRTTKVLTGKDVDYFSSIHRLITDIEHVRIPSYPQTRHPDMFKELHCDFLLNIIDEASWKQSMFLKENSFEKKQQIGMILNTFITLTNDLMRKLYNRISTDSTNKTTLSRFQKYMNEFEQIREYINESLVNTGKVMMCAVPQIISNANFWSWQPITRVEKILEEQKIA